MRVFRFLSSCFLVMISVCFLTWDLFASQWEKTIGGPDDDRGYSVQQTTDGGYIIAGYSKSSPTVFSDVYLIKIDTDGNKLWEKTFGGPCADQGNSVQQTTDGGYIIAGTFISWNLAGDCDSPDVYLIKTDVSGDKMWEKTFGGPGDDRGYSVQQTADGGYIIVGYSDSFGVVNNDDVYIIKINASGDKIWEKTFGGSRPEIGYSVQQTSDGGYIIAGGTQSFGAGVQDVYLIKTDSTGNEIWYKTFGGSNPDYAESIEQTADEGYVIVGHTSSFGQSSQQIYLIKTDTDGNLDWSKTFGGDFFDWGYAVQQTTDGGYIITGSCQQSLGSTYNLCLIKTNDTGDIEWSNNFNGWGSAYGHSVQQTADGGYISAGRTLSLEDQNNSDVYLIYYNKISLPKPNAIPSIPSLLLDD